MHGGERDGSGGMKGELRLESVTVLDTELGAGIVFGSEANVAE